MNLYYYQSMSGKNLILEYIDSLPVDEQVDGYSVLKNLEDGKLEQIRLNDGRKKFMRCIFTSIIVFFM